MFFSSSFCLSAAVCVAEPCGVPGCFHFLKFVGLGFPFSLLVCRCMCVSKLVMISRCFHFSSSVVFFFPFSFLMCGEFPPQICVILFYYFTFSLVFFSSAGVIYLLACKIMFSFIAVFFVVLCFLQHTNFIV